MIEKILERLEEKIEPTWKHDYLGGRKDAFVEAIAIVQEVAKEYGNGWIPCSDRLPRIGEQVMVCNRYGSVFVSHITYLNPRVDIHGECHDFGSHYSVIAWQPLPAPYQKGEKYEVAYEKNIEISS